MTPMTEERGVTESMSNQEDLEYKIEVATQTLDRNITFVQNCDNKTSIVLAAFGVLLTIILTNEGMNKIFDIIKTCIQIKTFCNIFYLVCFAVAIFVMLWGMFNLGSVLIARTSKEAVGRTNENSRIFFAGIKKSGDYRTYHQRFCAMSKEDLLNDLIKEIYINADIASIKYATYNLGLKRTSIGFIVFVVLLLVGIYIY